MKLDISKLNSFMDSWTCPKCGRVNGDQTGNCMGCGY
jgi:hypothetical protein